MSRKISIIESAMKNRQIVFLSMVLLIGLGVFALMNMSRQEFPVVTIRQGLVIGAYPGATSGQVEKQLTESVERYLFSFKEINRKKTYSCSRDGLMIIFVELNDKVKNADEFWSKLRHGLNNLKISLPAGVVALYADNDFGDTSALLISLEADHTSYHDLEIYLNQLEDKLRKIESVSKIRHYGLQKEQITIYPDDSKLSAYGINTSLLTGSLFAQGLTATGTEIDYKKIKSPVHIASTYETIDDLSSQIIYSDPAGNMLRLKDVADIVREYPEPESFIQNNGHKCLLISLEMLEDNNIVQFGKDVDKVLADFERNLPEGITIERIADQPYIVGKSVSTFMLELFFAVLSVILVTMLLLPLRVASVAALSIPITIFISLGCMYIFGLELNTVTLAALIVVLGMIVDNSIVIVDCYLEKLDHGVSRWFAAITSAKTYFRAVLSATLAISITFFPFLFTLKGTFRDFVYMFPWTVTLTLGLSLLVALLVIPYLQYFFIRRGFGAGKQKGKFNMLDFIQKTYEKYLAKAFEHPGQTIFIAVFSVVLAAGIFFLVPRRLLPAAERNQFAVEIYLPQGSSLLSTEKVADSMANMLSNDARVKSVTSFIGTSSPRFHTTYAPQIPAKNFAQFIVNTGSSEETVELLDDYADTYNNFFPEAYVRFRQLDYQPITAPIEIRISGDSIGMLHAVRDTLLPKLRCVKGIGWVRTDFGEMQPTARIDINSVEANRLGINRTILATNLAIRHNGIPVTTIWEDDYPVKVLIKNPDEPLRDIQDEYIRSVIPGISVPLRQIASVNPDWEEGQIVRRNGIRTLTILSDIKRNVNVSDVLKEVEDIVDHTGLPEGVEISYGGSSELDAENIPGIISGLAIAVFIIFMILLFHFRKISLAILVLLSSALSLFGAFLGVIVLRAEFGITSILGIVSLIGILVRNGIIMLDYAEELRQKHGRSVLNAAIEAGKRRMRPIFLTSAAASVGVIPMIISANPLWSPMGAVICFGTLTSMILLIFFLPVAYWLIFRNEDQPAVNHKTMTGKAGALIIMTSVLLLSGGQAGIKAQTVYTLDQCKKLALENNVKVRNAQLELSASRQTGKSAFTTYFPKISASAVTYKISDPLIDLKVPRGNLPVYNGDPSTIPAATQFALFPGISMSLFDKGTLGSITAIQPLFTGGRIINGNNLARVGIKAGESKIILSENEVLMQTEEQYWQIISLYEKRQILATTMNMLDSLYKEASDACNAGLINRNNVLKVALKQSEMKASEAKLENGIALAKMSFCRHLGIPFDTSVAFSDTVLMETDPAGLYINGDEALQNREELKLVEASVRAEKLKTRMKLGEYLPQAGIGAGALYYDIQDEGTTNTLIFGTVSIPLSDWWGGSHEIKERKYRQQIAENNANDVSQLLLLQIQQSWYELNESWQQIEIAQMTINQARDNLRVNRDNFRAGLIQISDMLEAQALLQQAENQLTEARSHYRIKRVSYLQVTGRYQSE